MSATDVVAVNAEGTFRKRGDLTLIAHILRLKSEGLPNSKIATTVHMSKAYVGSVIAAAQSPMLTALLLAGRIAIDPAHDLADNFGASVATEIALAAVELARQSGRKQASRDDCEISVVRYQSHGLLALQRPDKATFSEIYNAAEKVRATAVGATPTKNDGRTRVQIAERAAALSDQGMSNTAIRELFAREGRDFTLAYMGDLLALGRLPDEVRDIVRANRVAPTPVMDVYKRLRRDPSKLALLPEIVRVGVRQAEIDGRSARRPDLEAAESVLLSAPEAKVLEAANLPVEPSTMAALAAMDADDSPEFDLVNAQDARDKVLREISARRGQRQFRDALIDAYAGRCAITGCSVRDVLEAAHITPYRGPETNHVTNGLLLRADLHTLFDTRLLAVDPDTLKVLVAPSIQDSTYRELHGKPLRTTPTNTSAPSVAALRQHRAACDW